MKIKIKKLDEFAIIPKKATAGAAGYDVYLPHAAVVNPGRQIIPLGLSIELPCGYEAKIEPRSGFSSKGMEDHNEVRRDADVIVGKIDSDYRGPVGVIIVSRERYPFTLGQYTRIAQLTIYKVEDADFERVDELSETDRGNGGFGHTGTI